MNNHFPKSERIVSKKLMNELFTMSGSQSMVAFPIRAIYRVNKRQESEDQSRENEGGRTVAPQILISVPKRHFKHAVDRNRVKRQLREAYRLNKSILCDSLISGHQLLIAFVWLSDSHCPSAVVQQRVVSLLQRIAEKIKN